MTPQNASPAVPKRVLTFGEPLISLAHSGEGSLSSNRNFQLDIGGAELNTAIALGRLGVDVAYAAAVGNDPFGQLVLRELRAEGVCIDWVQLDSTAPTGSLFKMNMGINHDPSVYYYRSLSPMGMGRWRYTDVATALLKGSFDWVHATGITWMLAPETREASDKILIQAQLQQTLISFDINIRMKLAPIEQWRVLLSEVASFVTWMFIGDAEATALFGTEDPVEVRKYVSQLGFAGDGILLKRGERGATLVTADDIVCSPACRVSRVVDTVGAGDDFNAGWIAAQRMGWDLNRALKLANIVGAYAVTSFGDSSGYPTLSQATVHLDGGMR